MTNLSRDHLARLAATLGLDADRTTAIHLHIDHEGHMTAEAEFFVRHPRLVMSIVDENEPV